MSESYKKYSKLIISCLLGTSVFAIPAIAANQNTAVQKTATKTVPGIVQKAPIQITQPASSSVKLQGNVNISGNSKPITLSLRDSDVKQVLRMLADKAGYNIIFDNSVTGTVTLDLVNVSLDRAFDYVLSVTKLKYWIDNDTMIVAAADAAGDLGVDKKEMRAIKVKYLDAAKVAKFLNTNIYGLKKPELSSKQIAVTNPRTNEVLIFGTENDVVLAERVIKQLDIKPEMHTYNVNFVSPLMMGNLLCTTLFMQSGGASGGTSGGGTSGGGMMGGGMSGGGMMGGGMSGGGMMGGGMSGGGMSGGGSSGGSSGGGSSMGNLSMGGFMLCNGGETVSGDDLESMEDSSYKIIAHPDTGKITLIGGTREQQLLTAEFIKNTDVKQPQVYLEVSIIELSETGSKQLNAGTWTYTDRDIKITAVPSSAGMTMTLADPIKWNGTNPIRYPSELIQQQISLLIKQGKGKTLANPRIIATNNKESKINITEDFIETTSSTTSASNPPVTTKNYTLGNAGIEIALTPTVSPNGYVTIDIKPTYSTIKERLYDSNGDITNTLLNNRELELQDIRVKDGETLIIGGLMQEVETKTVQKIPGLGDLPIIGAAFRNASKDKSKSELIIMVTPKIIKDDDEIGST